MLLDNSSKNRAIFKQGVNLEELPNRWLLFVTWLFVLVLGLMAIGRGAWAFSCSDVTEIPKTECEVLVALYESTDGDNWKDNTGWLDTNTPCNWDEIYCHNGHVTRITLGGGRLVGTIPAELSNLSNLEALYLHANQLSGKIPPELGLLANLEGLTLNDNQLTGQIPFELGKLTKLQNLNLTHNNLTGQIPSELGRLINLYYLGLYNNQLTGQLSPALFSSGNFAKLENAYLHNNQLSGQIPPGLTNLTSLIHLRLDNNKLSGVIPNLSKLTILNLNNNPQLCRDISTNYSPWESEVSQYPECELSGDCEHATYSPKKRTLAVPFIEIPVIDFLTGLPMGEKELWKGSLRQVSGTTNRFKLISKTVKQITDGSSSLCPATYAVETGTLSIPFIDVPIGIAIGNKKYENGVDVFKASMSWVPMGKSFVIRKIEKLE